MRGCWWCLWCGALPRGPARPRHGVEVEGVADGQISLAGETEYRQHRAVESPIMAEIKIYIFFNLIYADNDYFSRDKKNF